MKDFINSNEEMKILEMMLIIDDNLLEYEIAKYDHNQQNEGLFKNLFSEIKLLAKQFEIEISITIIYIQKTNE